MMVTAIGARRDFRVNRALTGFRLSRLRCRPVAVTAEDVAEVVDPAICHSLLAELLWIGAEPICYNRRQKAPER
jgi:hypothetical protein